MAGKPKRWRGLGLALLALVLVGLAGPRLVRSYWWWREANPVRSGGLLAARLGCFACHGPGGVRGIPNPGAAAGSVPAWVGGTHMMYVQSEAEIAEYIEKGFPDRKRRIPSAWERYNQAEVRMPAYGDLLDEDELDDLVEYVKAVSAFRPPPGGTPAARGEELVAAWGCFGCHGPQGAGGLPNPRSLKGYIPGWLGGDFLELVRDDAELEEWIRTGTLRRLEESFLARFFLRRAPIPMPAYGDHLAPDEVAAIIAYIRHLRGEGGPAADPGS